jgi:hypothetical protein
MESNSIGNFEVGYINRVTLQDACMERRVTSLEGYLED